MKITKHTFKVSMLAVLAYLAVVYSCLTHNAIDGRQALAALNILWLIGLVCAVWACTHRTMLVLFLAGLLAINSQAQTNEFRLLSVEQQQPEIAPCNWVFGVIVIGIGGYIVYKICKSPVWTNLPPPPPPQTNPPPPPPPPRTNPPIRRACWVPLLPNVPEPPSTNGNLTGFACQPVTDTWSGGDAMFTSVVYGKFLGWQCSTNLVDWRDYSVTIWAGNAGALSVVYDGFGDPVSTNYVSVWSEPNSQYYVPPITGFWCDHDRPHQFFRFCP